MSKDDKSQEAQKPLINKNRLLLTVLISPKKTFNFIFANCPDKYISLFFISAGISNVINRASINNAGDQMDTSSVLTYAIIFGSVFGWLAYYLYAALMSITGSWLKGVTKARTFRTILAWSLVPSIFALLLFLPKLLIFGGDLFRSSINTYGFVQHLTYKFFTLLDILLAIWSLVILINGVSLVQHFGIAKSILNILLPAIIITLGAFLLFVMPYFLRDAINN